ncbi:MAG: TetR family transcriptional regulator [Gammaproteobacteria bacterium]|nr:MAG: TetR family transcriptional regulator [Gammaproteobacteria bacterium]
MNQSARQALRRGEGTAAILEAAEALFSEQGFDAVSLRQVAEQAGVSKANIIHHFGSKEGLYIAVLRGAVERCDALLESLEEGEPLERLRSYTRENLRQMFDQPEAYRLLLREVLEHGQERGRELATRVVGESFARLVALVREGQDAGALRREIDPGLMAIVLVACKVFLFQAGGVLRHLPGAEVTQDPDRYMEAVMTLLLEGAR